jgi:hypothetical protein
VWYWVLCRFKPMRHHVVILDLKLTQTHKLLIYLPQAETSFCWEYPLGLDPDEASRTKEVMGFEPSAQQPRQLSFEAPARWLRTPLTVLAGSVRPAVTLETCYIPPPPRSAATCHQNWNIPYTGPQVLLTAMTCFNLASFFNAEEAVSCHAILS